MGFLERWGAPDPLALLAQQAVRAFLQMAPKASSTPYNHQPTRTVSVNLRGGGGRPKLPCLLGDQPSPEDPVKGPSSEWGVSLGLDFTRWGSLSFNTAPPSHFGPRMTCFCPGA